MKKLLLIAAATMAVASGVWANAYDAWRTPEFTTWSETRPAAEHNLNTPHAMYNNATAYSFITQTAYELQLYHNPQNGWLEDNTYNDTRTERSEIVISVLSHLNRRTTTDSPDIIGQSTQVLEWLSGDSVKVIHIQDLIDAARTNTPMPDAITVQGQRAHNRGQRGVDLQTWTGSSNPRRPWQRNKVTVTTNINGNVQYHNVITTRNLVVEIDKISRSIAKAYYDKGFDEGYEDGYENGYRDGYRDGYNQALNDVGAEL